VKGFVACERERQIVQAAMRSGKFFEKCRGLESLKRAAIREKLNPRKSERRTCDSDARRELM